MILSPFDLAQFEPIAGLIPPIPKEPAVALQNDFARRLALLGHPGPFRSSPSNPGLVLDRADQPLEHVMPTVTGGPARREAAEISALALNRLCGFSAAEDKLDPEHIDDVRAESARFLAQTGRLADAAE